MLAKLLGREAKGQSTLTYYVTTGNLQLQGPAAYMEEVYENIEKLDKFYAHVVKHGYEGVLATPVGLEPLIDVLPQNPILQYQSEPDEEEFWKGPSEWMKYQTIPDDEDFKKAVNEMVCLGNSMLEQWSSWQEQVPLCHVGELRRRRTGRVR